MTRRIVVLAVVLLAVTVTVADAAFVTKVEATQAAINVTIKQALKQHVTLVRSVVKASCKAIQGEVNTYLCNVNGNAGQCRGSMTIFDNPPKGLQADRIKLKCSNPGGPSFTG
jgi:predicted RNA methylase